MRNWHGNLSPFGKWHTSSYGSLSAYAAYGFEPPLVLDFDETYYRTEGTATDLVSAATHARSSNAMMVDSDGVLKWAPHNLLAYSEDFTQAAWAKSGVTVNSSDVLAPDGTNTASNITFADINDQITQRPTVAAATYTSRIWVKGVSGETIQFAGASGDNVRVTLNGDWQLVEVESDPLETAPGVALNTFSGATARNIDIWGAHAYRSDLGGMVNNPTQPVGFETYVPTTSAAVYLPRVGHHLYNGTAWVDAGYFHESEARTNGFTNSGDMGGSGWTNLRANLTAGDDALGAGTFLLAEASETNSNGAFAANQTQSALAVGTYTTSVFVKAGPDDTAVFVLRPGVATNFNDAVEAWFDVEIGTVETTRSGSGSSVITTPVARIQHFGGGVYRCSLTFNVTSVATVVPRQYFSDADASLSVTVGKQIQVWGAQFEAASTPSSYIPTTTSTVTRAADTMTIPAANLPWPEPVVIGPELVTNGTFDTDVTGWNDNSTGTGSVSVVSGAARLTTVDPSNTGTITQQITTVDGETYQVSFDAANVSGSAALLLDVGTSEGPGNILNAGGVQEDGTQSFTFVANGAAAWLEFTVGSSGAVWDLDNVSVREINPLAVSIQMSGTMTYADEDLDTQIIYNLWQKDADNFIRQSLVTAVGAAGNPQFIQRALGVTENLLATSVYSPGVNVPFNIASRHGSTFLNGAIDGTALTADLTSTALPDLETANMRIASRFNGTIDLFRVWKVDITDEGIAEASST